MRASTSLQPSSLLARIFPFFCLLSGLLILGGWQTADLAAQNSGKKPSKNQEEEEDSSKTTKQKGKKQSSEEEDTTNKGKPKKPVPKVEEEGDEKPDAPPREVEGEPSEQFKEEERQAKHPLIKELFQKLATPYDLLIKSPGGSSVKIKPYRTYLGQQQNTEEITVETLPEKGKRSMSSSYGKREIKEISPYETVALNEVNKFIKSTLEPAPETVLKPPTRLEVLEAAEKVLELVSRYHSSALSRHRRMGEAWGVVTKALDKRLVEVRLDKLRTLTEQKDWDAAFTYGSVLSDKYPGRKDVQIGVARLLSANAEQSLRDTDYLETRKRLQVLEDQFPNSPEIKSIREKLENRAREKWEEAKRLEKNNQLQEAKEVLKTAESIYPLPGLRDDLMRLSNQWPILYVGVRGLPLNLSPTTAALDEEKQAVELLFESLVKLAPSEKIGQIYRPGLARDLPRMSPLGREFRLNPKALWSDGKTPITATDVRQTVKLLCDENWTGFSSEWASLMKDSAHVEEDNYHLNITLRQGYLDPLALMDFKVLPQWLQKADDADFAKKPVSSGPYRYEGVRGDHAVFLANSYYQGRGRQGQPEIREIHFFRSTDPATDFRQGKLHLLLDLPTNKLSEIDNLKPDVTIKTIRNRRIYFLAINHKSIWLEKNVALRRALAHAIDREKILHDVFRKDDAKRHRVLSSPFPPDSWACKMKNPLFDQPKAKSQADAARQPPSGNASIGTLKLLYPDDDPAVKEACEAIKAHVDVYGIKLELVGLSPRELFNRVEINRDFDLAYCHWDYANEAYWLWPLLDSQAAKSGRNYMSYRDDELDMLFRQAMTFREFAQVQRVMHSIDERLFEQMPLIPLWQLDTLLAVHKSVTMRDSAGREAMPDPLLIFTNIEKWTKVDK